MTFQITLANPRVTHSMQIGSITVAVADTVALLMLVTQRVIERISTLIKLGEILLSCIEEGVGHF